jgi:hypothetical protein
MTEIENDNIENMMIMLIKRNNKDYLIVVGANKSRDFVIFLIQRSSNVYCNKYVLEDFAKINFFKIYLGFGFRQCIEIMIDLLKQKKDLINLEEEENIQIKLSLDIEIGIVGMMNLNLPKERIEFLLKNHSIEQEIKNNLMWNGVLNLLQEKEDDQKKIKEQENKINQLTREQNIIKNEEKLKIHPYIGNNFNNINDLNPGTVVPDNKKILLDHLTRARGLENVGATCYMNATLQCLYHVKPLSENIINDSKINSKQKLTSCFKDLLVDLAGCKNRKKYNLMRQNYYDDTSVKDSVRPVKFKDLISNMNPLFK